METARVVSSPVLRFSGSRFLKLAPAELGTVNSRVSFRGRDYSGILSRGFSDSGHMQYYVSAGKKQKEQSKEIKTEKKKKNKLIKRLSKDLDLFSRMAHGEEFSSRLMGEVKGKMILEATEVLLAELRHLRTEQKEQKRKRKEEEKARVKAMVDSESSSSSSSSESSDSDCVVVMDMSRFRDKAVKQLIENETEQANYKVQEATLVEISSSTREDCCSNSSNDGESSGIAVDKKIEICMGGKCKKLGAVALLEEFERRVRTEGAVVGCKCMGKCKNGPNVKVFNYQSAIQDQSVEGSVEPIINPLSLCSGVGLEDVRAIVTNLLGKDRNNNCLAAAS